MERKRSPSRSGSTSPSRSRSPSRSLSRSPTRSKSPTKSPSKIKLKTEQPSRKKYYKPIEKSAPEPPAPPKGEGRSYFSRPVFMSPLRYRL